MALTFGGFLGLLRALVSLAALSVAAWSGLALYERFSTAASAGGPKVRQAAAAAPDVAAKPWAGALTQPLFGRAPTAERSASASAPEAQDYILRGLFRVDAASGLALIETAGDTALFSVGERLAGGERIVAFEPKAVLIEGPRGAAVISFDAEDAATAPATAAPAQAETPVEASLRDTRPPVALTRVAKALSTGQLRTSIRFERARARSGAVGLRIQWMKQTELSQLAGLQRNDVVLGINGQSVTSGLDVQTMMAALGREDEIRISIERNGAPLDLIIPLS
ncbi:MAG: PDZ domain-containing protein [Pseudomonadota bacterium]